MHSTYIEGDDGDEWEDVEEDLKSETYEFFNVLWIEHSDNLCFRILKRLEGSLRMRGCPGNLLTLCLGNHHVNRNQFRSAFESSTGVESVGQIAFSDLSPQNATRQYSF